MKKLYQILTLFLIQKIQKGRKSNMLIYSNDYIGNYINTFGHYEEEHLEFISQGFTNSTYEHLLDIGANIGNHSVYLSSYFNLCSCFEVDPETRIVLDFNTKKFNNVTVYDFGLGSSEGELILTRNKHNNLGGNRLTKEQRIDGIKVRVCTLDHLKFEDISFIKIDVEGYEEYVLNGAINSISKSLPVIAVELNSLRNNEVIRLLSELGYEFFQLSPYTSFEDSKLRFLKWYFFNKKPSQLVKIDLSKFKGTLNLAYALHPRSKNNRKDEKFTS